MRKFRSEEVKMVISGWECVRVRRVKWYTRASSCMEVVLCLGCLENWWEEIFLTCNISANKQHICCFEVCKSCRCVWQSCSVLSLRWWVLSWDFPLEGSGEVWGSGVGQLCGIAACTCVRMGISHQCFIHSTWPHSPVAGGQLDRLDRGADLLRGFLHCTQTVWREAQPCSI